MSPTGMDLGGLVEGMEESGGAWFHPSPTLAPLNSQFRIAVNCAYWSENSMHGSASAQPCRVQASSLPTSLLDAQGTIGVPFAPRAWVGSHSQPNCISGNSPAGLILQILSNPPRSALQPPKPVPPCGTLHLMRNRAPRDSPSLSRGSVTPQAAPTAQSRAGSVPTCCLRFPGL